MKFSKFVTTAGMALTTAGTAVGATITTVSCGPGVQKFDVSIAIDGQEVATLKPVIDAFQAATGLKVNVITSDMGTYMQDYKNSKISHTMPDIVMGGDPAGMDQEGLISKTTLREIFGKDSFVNNKLSTDDFASGTDKAFYDKLAKKYDLNIFKTAIGFVGDVTDEASAKEFLDKPFAGLPSGVTGWGMWIRQKQLKGWDEKTKSFINPALITTYLGVDGSEKLVPQPDSTAHKAFLLAYFNKVYKANAANYDALVNNEKFKKIFIEEQPTGDGLSNTITPAHATLEFGAAADGKGYYAGTPEGFQAFIAESQTKALKNPNVNHDGWFSIGVSAQYQRENAALYSSAKTEGGHKVTGLWDGMAQNWPMFENFDANGAMTLTNGAFTKNGVFVSDVLSDALYDQTGTFGTGSTPTFDMKYREKWFLYDQVYSGKSLQTNESRHGINDPASGFWKPQKAGASLPSALVKGQQWMNWPLPRDISATDERVDSVTTIAIPFKTPGQNGYGLSSDLANKPASVKTNALKLLRAIFSEDALRPFAAKLQSPLLSSDPNFAGQSISVEETQKTDNYAGMLKGFFTDVTIPEGKIDVPYTTIQVYTEPSAGKMLISKHYTPISAVIRKASDDQLHNYDSWKGVYGEIVNQIKNAVSAA